VVTLGVQFLIQPFYHHYWRAKHEIKSHDGATEMA
jgi:hypothetical protein